MSATNTEHGPSCPTPDELAALLVDDISDTAPIFEPHLAECARCRDLLDALAVQSEWWTRRRDLLRDLHSDVSDTPRIGGALEVAFPPAAHVQSSADRAPKTGRESCKVLQRQIGPWQIIDEIGRGGMGVVYKAHDPRLDRLVALKMMRYADAADDQLQRIQREAKSLAQLHHPNIVQIYEVGECDGSPWLALEYIDGPNLAEYLDHTPQPAKPSAEFVETLARAMYVAHGAGIVHRDLKPANILLSCQLPVVSCQKEDATFNEKPWQVATDNKASENTDNPQRTTDNFNAKITDFGLAKQIDSEGQLTRSGVIAGTPCYMAPEQAGCRAEEIGPAADVYALGATLYEMLTGRPPFKGETPVQTLQQVIRDEPVSPQTLQRGLPRDIATICLKCLEKEPARRYQSALQLADDLHRFREGEPIQARPTSTLGRLAKWARRRPAVAALLLLVGFVSVVGAALVTWKWREAEFAWREERQRAIEAERNRIHAQKIAVRTALGRGLALCEAGDVPRGILWLARSLDLVEDVPRTQRGDLESAIRWNLSFWGREVAALTGVFSHSSLPVHAAALSPDGRMLLTAGIGPVVQLWDVRTGRTLARVKHDKGSIHGVAFHPGGNLFVTAGSDGKARLFRFRSGQPPKLEADLKHGGAVHAVAFHPDGREFATASDDGRIRLWSSSKVAGADLETDIEPRRPIQLTVPCAVLSLAYRSDGAELVVGCQDGTARRWSTKTRQALGKPLQHPGGWQKICGVAYSPQGRYIAAGSLTGKTYVWECSTDEIRHVFRSDSGSVRTVAFSPDGQTLATGGGSRAVRFWDLTTGQLRNIPLRHANNLSLVAFSADSKRILTGSLDGTARLWRVPSASRSVINVLPIEPSSKGAIDPCQLTLFSGTAAGRSYLWDETGKQIGSPLKHAADVWTAAFDRTGQLLATGTRSGIVRAWKTSTQKPLTAPLVHGKNIAGVAFSPNGKELASASSSARSVRVWDVATGRCRLVLKHADAVTALVFRPNGSELITATRGGKVHFWHLNTGKPVGRVLDHGGQIHSLAISPDGRYLVTGGYGDATARLWELSSGRPVGPVMQHRRAIMAMAFSPDSRLVAIGSRDKLARLWLVPSGRPIGPVMQHTRGVDAVAFSADGKTILTTTGAELRKHNIYAPREGSAAQIMLWAEVNTGMTLDDDNVIPMDAELWRQKEKSISEQPLDAPDDN